MNILIAEDEKQIAESLKKNFLDEGHSVITTEDGETALSLVDKIKFDILLLDWKMPKVTGFEVCKIIREKDFRIPIILITALDEINNKVSALNAGADDYITKPFSFEELKARINAVIRRANLSKEILEFGSISLDLSKRRVISDSGDEIYLTDKEFDLLKLLIIKKGEIVNKETLCKLVWNLNFVPETNICEATIKNVRKKLEEITGKKFIKTIYGEGYTIVAE